MVDNSRKKLKWTITNFSYQVPVGVSRIYVQWPTTNNNDLKSITFISINESAPPSQPWLPPSVTRFPNQVVSFGQAQEDLVLTFASAMETGIYHIEVTFDRSYCQVISVDYPYVQ
jgi:hypothetical protein